MKQLTEYLNEARKRFKKFEDIKYGDKGEDYNGDQGTVEWMGTTEEMTEHDESGMLEDGISGMYIEKDWDAVVCRMKDGSMIGYVYGDDGFRCYK